MRCGIWILHVTDWRGLDLEWAYRGTLVAGQPRVDAMQGRYAIWRFGAKSLAQRAWGSAESTVNQAFGPECHHAGPEGNGWWLFKDRVFDAYCAIWRRGYERGGV